MSVRKIPGKGWFVDFQLDGVRIRKKSPVPSRRGAEEYERQIREAWLSGPGPEDLARKVTLKEFRHEFIEKYARVYNKPSEQAGKESDLRAHLIPAMGDRLLSEIGPKEISTYQAQKLKGGLAKSTINKHLACLSKMLHLAEEWGYIQKVPKIRKLKVPPQPFDFLTSEEAVRLLDAARPDPESWTMILLAVRTGLGVGELVALKWEDVDLPAAKLVVRRSIWRGIETTPKSGKNREIPLSGQTVAALKAHRHLRSERVFCEEDGSLLDKDNAKYPLRRACRRAGLRQVSWHVLRHTFASHLVMAGKPLKVVQELMGHANITTTLRYAHLSPEIKQDAVDCLDRLGEKGYASLRSLGNIWATDPKNRFSREVSDGKKPGDYDGLPG